MAAGLETTYILPHHCDSFSINVDSNTHKLYRIQESRNLLC